MKTKEKFVLAIGELLVDAITNVQVDDLSYAQFLNIHPGGSTANFCRYLSRCGTTSKLVAAVGDDGFGKILIAKVLNDDLPIDNIKSVPGHNTSLIVVGRTSKTPDFIPYRDADRYITTVEKKLLKNASLVHTTAFSLSKDPARASILKAFATAHHNNIPVSVDWNYSEKIWGINDEGVKVFEQLQQFHPLLKFSMDDVARFVGHKINIQEALNFLAAVDASLVCLTCGAEGVFYNCGKIGEWKYRPAAKIKVENATGAGDAFWAGFIHAWDKGMDAEKAIDNGIDIASKKLQGKLLRAATA